MVVRADRRHSAQRRRALSQRKRIDPLRLLRPVAPALGRPDGKGHGKRRPLRRRTPRRLSQRHLRQRGRADHRRLSGQRGTLRHGEGQHHRFHHRQHAAGAGAEPAVRRTQVQDPELQPHVGGPQRLPDAAFRHRPVHPRGLFERIGIGGNPTSQPHHRRRSHPLLFSLAAVLPGNPPEGIGTPWTACPIPGKATHPGKKHLPTGPRAFPSFF